MTDFFENLTSLTNNISDIVFSRYADVVSVNDDGTYDCLDANKVKHAKVVNSTVLTFEVHDKVILGFLDNNEYSAIILGGVGRGLNLSEYAKLSDLEQKADKIHNHDDKYYTQLSIDSKLMLKADLIHNHDDLYYSKHEVDELSAQINVKLWVDNYNPIKGDKILFSMQITKSNELLKNYEFELVINDDIIVPLTTDDKGTCTYEYVCSQEGLNKFSINNTSLYLVVTRDSGWQNVNFLAGYEGNSNQGNVTYRRKGDVVTIKGGWYPLQDYSASNARVAFATIPEEIAPSGNLYTVQVGASMNKYLLTITPDGTLGWSKYGTTNNLNLPKNTRMVLTVTYII